jgi:hypothetical protein
VGDRPTDRTIVDSKWVCKIRYLSDSFVDKFKVGLVAKRCYQIQGQDYDEMFVPVALFDFLHYLLSIVTGNVFVPHQLDVNTAFLYRKLIQTIYMHPPEGYRDGNTGAHLQRYIYRLKNSQQEISTLVLSNNYEDTSLTHPTLNLLYVSIREIHVTSLCISMI